MLRRFAAHLTYANVMATVAVFFAFGGVAYAVSSGPVFSGNNVIHACYAKSGGDLRIVSAGKRCHRSERRIAWNQAGPQGLPGRPGTTGANGTNGTNAATNVVVRSNVSLTGFVKVECNAGEKVTGGGGYANPGFDGTQPDYTVEGGPATGWKTYSTDPSAETYAYVVCASP